MKEKLDAVQTVNSVRADETLSVVNTVHRLVNSNMRIALQNTAMYAQRIADLTGKPEDADIAATARKALADHVAAEAKG